MHRKLISTVLSLALIASIAGCSSTEETDATLEEETMETTIDLINQVADEDVPEIEGYSLLWHDEFNGTTLNESIWNRELREPGWTNNELQEYTDSEENIYVQDGCLVLRAIQTIDENGDTYYTSGKVNSQNNTDFMYGRVEVRARVPEGQGLWPAAWMMPTDESYYGQWPKCGEIDIMEVLGHNPASAFQTIHYGEPHGQQQGSLTLDNGTFATDFHVYVVEWEPGEMRFYIDDELTLTVNDWFSADGDNEQEYPAPFNQTFFVQMNLAVGGDWPGNPDETTNFDTAMFEIDYVRVYQKPEYDTNVSRPVYEAREAQEDGNFVVNGDFSDDSIDLTTDTDWNFLLFEGGAGAASIHDNMIEITTDAEGSVDYSVQLVFWDIPFENGGTYRVTFDARADEDRNMISSVTAPFADWIRYYPDTEFDLTTEWQTYEYEFDMTERDDPRGRLEFNMGNRGSSATINITNVRVERIS
ncbi:MAG: family 16 glycosylhydrolase [Saccharofermentans sp.]|nr:family 16 glycosylhydrolase [Saccharofermentans sp.]